MVVNFILSPVFNAKSWSRRIVIDQTHEFNDDIALVNYQSLPLLDKDSSRKLGDRVMGQMPELVSQFYVSDLYTQINYNADIVRVTPLEYNGFIKYLNNRKNGVKGYITVNSVTGDADLVKLDKGMQYMPSAYFFDNLDRHLRFKYPTVIFDDEKFEIDNDGNPYWVVPTVRYSGVGIKKEITGVILVNAIDGSSQKYDVGSIPTWVDQVYSAELIIEQVDNWGLYKNGFINSLFTQNGVVQTTEGYNYTVMNDDVYLYTGITSVLADESNIGFIMTNLRTKETRFYQVPGAEEYSAMASAEGQVQQMKYEASFPLLINLNGRPTYLMSLKDAAGLVKMYAFVDVGDYQKVVVSDSSLGIEAAKHRNSVYFITCHNLMQKLNKAQKENRLDKQLQHLAQYRLLIIDEIGYLPVDHQGSNLFFQLIARRYMNKSTIVTTNMPFSRWGEVFSDNALASAVLDRLLHYSHIIRITGNSYRIKDKIVESDSRTNKYNE